MLCLLQKIFGIWEKFKYISLYVYRFRVIISNYNIKKNYIKRN